MSFGVQNLSFPIIIIIAIIIGIILLGIIAFLRAMWRIKVGYSKLKAYKDFAKEWDPVLETAKQANSVDEIILAAKRNKQHKQAMQDLILYKLYEELSGETTFDGNSLVTKPYKRIFTRLLVLKKKRSLDLLEQRLLYISAMVKEDNPDQTMPNFNTLIKLSRDTEKGFLSVVLLETMASVILVCGIGGTLYGLHDKIGVMENMSMLKTALFPSLIAVGGTMILAILRTIYTGRHEHYMMKLDDITMAHFYPALQPQSVVDSYIKMINEQVLKPLGVGQVNYRRLGNASLPFINAFKQMAKEFVDFSNSCTLVFRDLIKSKMLAEEVLLGFEGYGKAINCHLQMQCNMHGVLQSNHFSMLNHLDRLSSYLQQEKTIYHEFNEQIKLLNAEIQRESRVMYLEDINRILADFNQGIKGVSIISPAVNKVLEVRAAIRAKQKGIEQALLNINQYAVGISACAWTSDLLKKKLEQLTVLFDNFQPAVDQFQLEVDRGNKLIEEVQPLRELSEQAVREWSSSYKPVYEKSQHLQQSYHYSTTDLIELRLRQRLGKVSKLFPIIEPSVQKIMLPIKDIISKNKFLLFISTKQCKYSFFALQIIIWFFLNF